MFGLTPLGVVHTAISLVALAAGIWALVRDHRILPGSTLGRVYIWTTVLTCLTGFGIFQHGGFGKPHALGVLTLIVLAVALAAPRVAALGRAAPYLQTLGLSLTFFFHLIPGATETFTRLPMGAPVFSSPEDPTLQKIVGALFLGYVIGAVLQARRLRRT